MEIGKRLRRHPVKLYMGDRIETLRCERRLPQETLAAELGLTFQCIEKMEAGITDIPAHRLYKIARFFETDIAYFFPDTPEAKPRPVAHTAIELLAKHGNKAEAKAQELADHHEALKDVEGKAFWLAVKDVLGMDYDE